MSESALVRGQPTKRSLSTGRNRAGDRQKRFPMDETEREMVQKKVDLLNLADVLGMSEACRVLGFSTASYYRFKKAYETGGAIALRSISRRSSKPILKNRVEPAIERAIIEMAIENPAFGQVRVANELTRRGQFVSPNGVRGVWIRNDLLTFARRVQALEARLAQNQGMVLTEQQVRAMEKAMGVLRKKTRAKKGSHL